MKHRLPPVLHPLTIPPLDTVAMTRAQNRLDNLTKPLGSLGDLEPLMVRMAGITGHVIPRLTKPAAFIFAADHGVAEAGVSAYDQHVTEEMAVNIAMGTAVSSVLARQAGIPLTVVDVGVCREVRHPGVVVRKSQFGTRNITNGPAMSEKDLDDALETGWDLVQAAADAGCDFLIVGELGIANTTASTALASRLLDRDPKSLMGRGTGISDAQWQQKAATIAMALAINPTDPEEPLQILGHLGGFEIAALVGAILAAASRRIPILLDGVTTGVAALTASRIAKGTEHYLVAGHLSPEPAHKAILAELGLSPILNLQLHLGEASGALLAAPLMQQALTVMAETATFGDARVSNPHQREPVDAEFSLNLKTAPVSSGFSDSERDAVYKVIQARRDIRVFLPDPLPDSVLSRILTAGHLGPSVGYMQPWNFILIRDLTLRQRLQHIVEQERVRAAEHYEDLKRDYYLRLKVEGLTDAPITLCVTNDPTRGGPHVLGRNTIPETDLMSTACAIENIWLAARAEGVAVGWVSMYQKEEVREILGIPGHIDPVALLSLGYTPHFPEIPVLERVGWGRRLDLNRLVFLDGWGNEARLSE